MQRICHSSRDLCKKVHHPDPIQITATLAHMTNADYTAYLQEDEYICLIVGSSPKAGIAARIPVIAMIEIITHEKIVIE